MISKPRSMKVFMTILALIIAPTLASSMIQPLTSVATLTTLPPASPTGNNTDPCAFSDRKGLFDRIHNNIEAYNVSLLVRTCPEICTLVYGSGNPDISGIGAMISYIIQGISVFFFGPWVGLATCIFDVNHKLSQPLARWHRQAILLANISIYISQGSIFVALSTSIASIIRLTHTPPLHEQYFLQSLNAYQFFVSVGAMIPLCSMSGYHERKLTALRLFGAAACLLSFYASETEFSPRLNAQSISQFNASCLDNPMTDGSQGSKQVWSPELTVIIVIALGWFVWTVINIIFGHTFRRASDRVDSAIQHYLHITPDDVVISIVISLLIMSWIKWCYYFIQILQGQRRKAQSFSGEAYEDSKWGFGQVTIMLLWAPLINDIVLEIIEYFWPQSGSDQVEVALNRSVEETMRLSDEEHHIENSVALFDDRPYEDIEETSSIPLNDGGQFHDLESTSPLINDNAVNHDDAFQMEAEANSPFRFSFAEGGEPTTTSTEIVNDSPTNPQVKQRTWPRNEDGTYLPNRISKALLK